MMMFELQRLTGCLGARLTGIDLNRELDSGEIGLLRKALHEHLVLVLPDQPLSPEAHVRLGRQLGGLAPRHPLYPIVEGHENIMVIENGPERPPDSEAWHSDLSFRPDPPQCSLLQAKALPPHGGDTMFANLAAVYEDLSEPMQAFLSGLSAVHDMATGFREGLVRNGETERLQVMESLADADRTAIHPVVGVHPVTGRKYLDVDDCFVSHIVELQRDESDALLAMLRQRLKEPRYHLRVAWKVDGLAIWDNIATHHYAVGDYQDYRRMHRVTVKRFHDF